MKNNNIFSKFIQKGNFSQEKIDYIKDYYELSDNQLIRKTFKYLNAEIGIMQDNSFFENAITNAVELLYKLCNDIDFDEEEVIVNRKRIKKSREAILANANRFDNQIFLEAANKLDEIILDKNLNLDDLKKIIIKLIERKEDINIIKKLLNTNKGVLLSDNNALFNYVFNLAINAVNNDTPDIYYYISLLKVFYTSNIDRKEFLKLLDNKFVNENEFISEIYMILMGVKRGLTPQQIFDKYGIITDFRTPSIIIPNSITTDKKIITIDGTKTNLRDDAISIKKDGSNYIIGIYISDAPYLIKPNSYEDFVARNNFKCLYMRDGKVRLLSSDLENALSLKEKQPRKAIAMYITINSSGKIIDYKIDESVIKVTRNLSYNQSNDLLNIYDHDISDILVNLYDAACLLDSDNPQKQLYWDKKDNSSFEKRINNSKSDKIVSELMVLYNRLIAKLMCDNNFPFIYRTQSQSYIHSLVKKMGIEIDESTKKTIDSIYMDSKYSIYPRYHNGLNIPIYSHSSDTLRRYPDLYNLYLMHAFYFHDLDLSFNQDKLEELVSYFNQRNVELSLLEGEYERAVKLQRVKTQH